MRRNDRDAPRQSSPVAFHLPLSHTGTYQQSAAISITGFPHRTPSLSSFYRRCTKTAANANKLFKSSTPSTEGFANQSVCFLSEITQYPG